MAALFAASHAYDENPFAGAFFGAGDTAEECLPIAMIAAEFFRKWPDSTAEAVVIHLRRRGFKSVTEVDRRISACWAVFAFTLRTLDQVAAAEKAEAEAAARAEEKRRLLVDRDRLAMTPEDDSPLSEYGKAAMRRRESPQGEKPRNDQE